MFEAVKPKITFKKSFKTCLRKGHVPVKRGDILGTCDAIPVEQIIELKGQRGRRMVQRYCLRCGTAYWNWLKEDPTLLPQLTPEQIAEVLAKYAVKENTDDKEESDKHPEERKPS